MQPIGQECERDLLTRDKGRYENVQLRDQDIVKFL